MTLALQRNHVFRRIKLGCYGSLGFHFRSTGKKTVKRIGQYHIMDNYLTKRNMLANKDFDAAEKRNG